MLRAEIAGRRIAPPQEAPAKGALIRDFQLSSAQGKQMLLSGRQSKVVLIFAGESKETADFLSNLQRHQTELVENETSLLKVFAGSQQNASDLETLFAWISRLWLIKMSVCSAGRTDPAGHLCPAVFITDRLSEVFAAYSVAHDKVLPGF